MKIIKLYAAIAAAIAAGFAMFFALPASAANTYWRIPADAAVTSTVTLHYDYTNWDGDVLPYFSGDSSSFQYMLLHVTNGAHQYNSAVIPCSDIGGADQYCTGTSSTPRAIDFTTTLATGTVGNYYVRLCGSNSPSVDANGYFTSTNSCITYYGFSTSPVSMLSDSFVILDTAAPSVLITAPASGGTVSSTITVAAYATDDVAVAGVQFQLDGANLGPELGSAPYAIAWNTASSTNGAHILTAIARDGAGNLAASDPVSVAVANSPPLPPLADPSPKANPPPATLASAIFAGQIYPGSSTRALERFSTTPAKIISL